MDPKTPLERADVQGRLRALEERIQRQEFEMETLREIINIQRELIITLWDVNGKPGGKQFLERANENK